MKSSTRLDSVVFQLTPTRTRCDLLITANGKTEKVATGLIDPFLAHLKTAQDQMAKGGYSIILKPEANDNAAAWFTKGTIERFVRFVSNPEVLERVYTLEIEIIQIKEASGIQNNCEVSSRPSLQHNEEKAIVLYEPDSNPKANRSNKSDENSKAQVLKVLETRKTVLQKEQGMAFARAVAAGFDVDDMLPLISFAKTFGASRLMDACSKFKDLWKKKHETGQWVDIEATMNDSDVTLANGANMQRNSWPGTPENGDVKSPTDNKPIGTQEQMQGQQQQPQPMYPPPWPVHSPPGTFHSPPGTFPVFQGYTMQGMPYYPCYPGASPYPSTGDSKRSSSQRKSRKHHSSSSEDDSDSEVEDIDREKGKSGRRRKSGRVVIRNINYVNSKKKDQSGSESEANESHEEVTKERAIKETDADTGDWNAFQTYLLQDADRDERDEQRSINHMMEKEVAGKKGQGKGKYDSDPLAYNERESDKYQERGGVDVGNGTGTRRMMRGSNDLFMVQQRDNESSSNPLNLNGFDHLDKSSSVIMDESHIVTRRSEAGSNNKRNAIDMGSEMLSSNQTDGKERRKQINYEPHDLSLMPERETEKLSAGYDPTLDFVSKKNGPVPKKGPKSRLSNTDKKKTSSGPIRKGRPTKLSPLDEAKARADKLRSFKTDLMKAKKEKEEEQRKRIETLKLERQKRIASKTNSAAQTRKPVVNRFSPGAIRNSKFTDSEPGLVSPLQRLTRRTASLGSNDFNKLPKNSKPSSGSKLTRSMSPLPTTTKRENITTGNNRLTRSISPLPPSKRETRVSLETQKNSVTRTRRLSEPKISSNTSAQSSSVRSRRSMPSRKASEAPEIKKLSAIVNYDIAKIASLPELKIKPTKVTAKTKTPASEVVEETPEIEKTVVMVLPSSAKSISTEQMKHDKSEVVSESGNDIFQVRLETLSDLVTETPKFLTSQSVVVQKPYEAPYARVSSLEDSQPHAPILRSNERQQETVKVPEVSDKSQTKESGLRKLLKFGKKSQTEAKDHDQGVAVTSEAFTLKNLISQDETPTAASQKSSRHFSLLSPFKNKKTSSS